MCRMAGWHGPEASLASLLYDPPHGLSTQAWKPKEMLYGNVNVDGTGVIWWPPGAQGQPPMRYVTPAAAWNDANLPALAARLTGTTIIAAVRSATAGIPFGPTNVAPFTREHVGMTHNGFIQNFRAGIGRTLNGQLSDDAYNELDAVSDSQTILLLVRTFLAKGHDLPTAMRHAIEVVEKAVRDAGVGATLNLLASDGKQLVATRASVGLEHNSLYMCEGEGITIASEAMDMARDWQPVAPQTMLIVDHAGLSRQSLD